LYCYSRTRISAQNAYQWFEHTATLKLTTQNCVASLRGDVCSNNLYAFCALIRSYRSCNEMTSYAIELSIKCQSRATPKTACITTFRVRIAFDRRIRYHDIIRGTSIRAPQSSSNSSAQLLICFALRGDDYKSCCSCLRCFRAVVRASS
jgi:hypothetical protein